jgi:glycosyltransferase involved in cell wall biosynthesis
MRFTFFGGYDPAYPRNAVLRKGLRLAGADVRECRVSPSLKFWARYPALAIRFRRDTDILIVPEFCQKDMPPAAFLARLTGKRIIFDPLAARFETKIVDWGWRPADSPAARWNRRIDRKAFRLADLILADTAAHKDYFCAEYGLSATKIEVLPVGYDDELYRPAPDVDARAATGRSEGTFDVMFFGSFLPLHGAEVIVQAARTVAASDPSVRFTLVGDGRTLASVRAAATGLANITFVGRMPESDLRNRLAAADLALGVFGRTEKARRVVPNKIFQSMGAGKAVITARTPAVEELFRDDVNIRLCGEPLAETLASAVLELKRDPDLRGRLARAGLARVQADFTSAALGRRLVEIAAARFGSRAR